MVNINIEIDDEIKNFELPESWDEITIGNFVKLFSFDREGMSELEVVIKAINLLTDIDEDLLMMIDYQDFETLANILSFINGEMKPTDTEYVEIEGDKYYLKNDFNQLTMGEVISIETILQQADNNLFKVMDKLLCIFLRKKKDNGKLETFKGEFMYRSEMFNKLPITKVYNVFSFFLNGGITSPSNTKEYLVKKPRNKKNKTGLGTSDNK